MNPWPDGTDYVISSFGADWRPRGDGVDADLSTSSL